MKIVIDARMYQESGVGRYIRNLTEQLKKLDRKNNYLFLKSNIKWYGISEQIKLPKILAKLKPDLVHFPHFNVPIFYSGKFVVTIHDLIHQHFAMNRATILNPITYKIKQLGYKKIFKHAITKSEKILVPSIFVKKQLVSEWKVSDEKIVVTPEAVDDKIFTIVNNLSSGKLASVMNKFDIKKPYLFYVGNAHPHKNVEGLIKSFLNLRKKYQYFNLVLSGHDHYFWQKIRQEYQHKNIIYTGFVSDEELVALYKNAKVFVLPSFEEGFGIPLLEAMACSCPVVSSNAGSLPEVGGDGVVYFDPASLDDMVDKISQVLNSERLRKDLIIKGEKRAKLFSWKRLAKQTLEVYSKCV